ncbi:metal ABC transporter permease [Staphylococcus capitis]|uniref:metal ABC transporter permease n=1 Tax=Staphylococcus capitis TaxID=29388 RepID=UPI0021B33DA9|nr:metal ABC transporter permease [Staphylococcus capitis]
MSVVRVIVVFYGPLMICSFEGRFSGMRGLKRTVMDYFVMVLVAVVRAGSIERVGMIVVVGLLMSGA